MQASARIARVAAAGLGLVLLGAGCANIITFSKDARRDGLVHFEQGRFADAAGSFQNAVRQNPRDYRSMYYLGASYDALDRPQQALAWHKAALDALPLTLEGKQDIAFRTRIINGLAGAIGKSDPRDEELNAYVARARGSADPYDHLLVAQIYAAKGDADSAIEAFNMAALNGPKAGPVYREYGLYLEHVGQREAAEQQIARAAQLLPQDPEVAAARQRLSGMAATPVSQ